MDSALTPREIQTRIRSGEALDEVAKAAGVPSDQIEPYAAPVVAEREHVADTAQSCPVRRTGETSSVRSLKAVVGERLTQRNLTGDAVTWDAWRDPDRRWTVSASYTSGKAEHRALFTFDLRARFSVAANDDARWLIGEVTPSHGPQPGRKRRDPDSEPTVDLNDEWALVRAIQSDDDTGEAKPVRTRRTGASKPKAGSDSTTGQRSDKAAAGSSEADPADYTEAELAEVDGVYDIVPPQTDMDVLYDMLSSFNEDSVNIYAGLTRPVVDDDPQAAESAPSREVEDARDEEWEESDRRHRVAAAPVEPEPEPEAAPDAEVDEPEVVQPDDADADEAVQPEPDEAQPDEVQGDPLQGDEPAPAPDAPHQDTLLAPEDEPTIVRSRDEIESSAPARKPAKRKGRAQVPSWDEIMFGSPAPKKDAPKG